MKNFDFDSFLERAVKPLLFIDFGLGFALILVVLGSGELPKRLDNLGVSKPVYETGILKVQNFEKIEQGKFRVSYTLIFVGDEQFSNYTELSLQQALACEGRSGYVKGKKKWADPLYFPTATEIGCP